MVKFCKSADIEARLERTLTASETQYLDGKIEEAQVLVVGYLGCGDTPYAVEDDVPAAVRIVTSRMVARVIKESGVAPAEFGATQIGTTTGPFSKQMTFQPGSRQGSPWLQKSDREALDPYRCDSQAFAVDTVAGGSLHSAACSLNFGAGYCSCGASIAGHPIYGPGDD